MDSETQLDPFLSFTGSGIFTFISILSMHAVLVLVGLKTYFPKSHDALRPIESPLPPRELSHTFLVFTSQSLTSGAKAPTLTRKVAVQILSVDRASDSLRHTAAPDLNA